MQILVLIIVFGILIFVPDIFIPKIINKLTKKLDGSLTEDHEWRIYSRYTGWVERCLYGVFFIFIQTQFVTFVGIWLAMKVVGSFNTWQPKFDNRQIDPTFTILNEPNTDAKSESEHRKRRARHIIFTIGTGLSLLWVLLVGLLYKKYCLIP